MTNILSTQPYKGTQDLLYDDYAVQKYIFDVWRGVCIKFNYQEYITPTIEFRAIYEEKSGAVKDELFTLTDRAGRNLALRPEMTPSITRAVSSIYKKSTKPLRLFSIANFFRNEAPQKGRQREFWQLNFDIFGSESLNADVEIMSMAIEIMRAFNSPADSYILLFNNRILLNEFFSFINLEENKRSTIVRIMDKFDKQNHEDLIKLFAAEDLSKEQIQTIMLFLNSSEDNFEQNFLELSQKEGYQQIKYISNSLKHLGYNQNVRFSPSVIRGFDYYDGTIFEVFDLNPQNNRSLFGGGRYNGLSKIFGQQNFPATGFAPGATTTRIFLENWNLIPILKRYDNYFIPLLIGTDIETNMVLANKIRGKDKIVETDLTPRSISDAIRYALKLNFRYIIINGESEQKRSVISVKDLKNNTQSTYSVDDLISNLT